MYCHMDQNQVVVPAHFVPVLITPYYWSSRLVYHQTSIQGSLQYPAIYSNSDILCKYLVSLSTQDVSLATQTASTMCNSRISPCSLQWVRYGDSRSCSHVLLRYMLCTPSRASSSPVRKDIEATPWMNWEICSPHIAAVCCPSSVQIKSVLLQVEMIAGGIHSRGVTWCRPWQSSTGQLNDCRYGYIVDWILVPCWLHGQLASAVQWSLQWLCWICPLSPCISQGYDLHHHWVLQLLMCRCISLYLQPGIWEDHRERKPGICRSSGLPRGKPNTASPTTSELDSGIPCESFK